MAINAAGQAMPCAKSVGSEVGSPREELDCNRSLLSSVPRYPRLLIEW